jgi:hypothetical protein
MPKLSERPPLPYVFEWPVDQDGYDIIREERSPHEGRTDATILGGGINRVSIQRRGGPLHMTRPMETAPALWRNFGSRCVDEVSLLTFVNEHGLPFEHPNLPGAAVHVLLDLAMMFQDVGTAFEEKNEKKGREILNGCFGRNAYSLPITMSATIVSSPRGSVLKPVPRNLMTAMLVQAADAITGETRHRQCTNCMNYFVVGVGYHSIRRDFCTNACRVAAGRKRLKGAVIAEGV